MLGRRDLPALVAGVMLVAALSAPVALGAEPACTQFGTAGDDEVYVVPPGTVYCGLEGDDTVQYVYGTFSGGPGDDFVAAADPETSRDDCVAMVYGGEGDDTVWINCGTFEGGPGDDLVAYNEPHVGRSGQVIPAIFDGGPGDDCVAVNWGGIIDSAVLDYSCAFPAE